jgi:uncharacterized protein (TIGR03067 family)
MGASLVLVLGSMAFLPGDSRDDALKAELQKLEGTWVHVTTERDGKKRPEPRTLWVFDGNRAKVHFSNRPANVDPKKWTFQPEPINLLLTYHFKLDPSQKPKALDQQTQFKGDKAPGDHTERGIYKLVGDTLTICFAGYNDKGKRPRDFKAAKGSDRRLIVLKRESQ